MPDAASVSRKLACLFYRQIERQHAVDAGVGRLPRKRVEPEPQQRVGVAEDDDRRRHLRPHLRDHRQRRPQAAAGRERPLGRALNHRAVGQRIGERHADLEHVGAGAIERLQDLGRARQIRIAGGRVRDEAGPLLRAKPREGVVPDGC